MPAIWRDDADGRILARNELTAAHRHYAENHAGHADDEPYDQTDNEGVEAKLEVLAGHVLGRHGGLAAEGHLPRPVQQIAQHYEVQNGHAHDKAEHQQLADVARRRLDVGPGGAEAALYASSVSAADVFSIVGLIAGPTLFAVLLVYVAGMIVETAANAITVRGFGHWVARYAPEWTALAMPAAPVQPGRSADVQGPLEESFATSWSPIGIKALEIHVE